MCQQRKILSLLTTDLNKYRYFKEETDVTGIGGIECGLVKFNLKLSYIFDNYVHAKKPTSNQRDYWP